MKLQTSRRFVSTALKKTRNVQGRVPVISSLATSYLLQYSIEYLSAQASNSSYKVKNCFNTEENYVVCDVYKLNGIGGMSLSQFATKLCFQRGNESVQNSSCKFASLMSSLESGS